MHSDNAPNLDKRSLMTRTAMMLAGSSAVAVLGYSLQLTVDQILSASIFCLIILATLFFWTFRLAIAFVGTGVLFATRSITVHNFIYDTELPIILFLVGMMVVVGVLKELGLFTWIIQLVINAKGLSGRSIIIIIGYLGALLSCAVNEVTSIVFVAALIFQICDTLQIPPTPFIIIAVITANVGSAGTMLGNPVGILIGSKGGFSFMDFIYWAFPIMIVSLTFTMFALCFVFRKEIKELDKELVYRRKKGLGLGPAVNVPYRTGLAILGIMVALIASHHSIETLLQLEKNTILIIAPLVVAGVLMIWRHNRARHYIETEVEWWTLLFFMMLFAVAGSLKHSGVTEEIANGFRYVFGNYPQLFTPAVIFISAIGSAFVDNIVFVAAFIPVVDHLKETPLWWALLFGACFGGNITMIGSTANIVALGMLEKRSQPAISFVQWLKAGAAISFITCAIAWVGIYFLAPYMPKMKDAPTVEISLPSEEKSNNGYQQIPEVINLDWQLKSANELLDFKHPPAKFEEIILPAE